MFEAKQDFSFYAIHYRKGQQISADAFSGADAEALAKAGRIKPVDTKEAKGADAKQQSGDQAIPDGGKQKGR